MSHILRNGLVRVRFKYCVPSPSKPGCSLYPDLPHIWLPHVDSSCGCHSKCASLLPELIMLFHCIVVLLTVLPPLPPFFLRTDSNNSSSLQSSQILWIPPESYIVVNLFSMSLSDCEVPQGWGHYLLTE